MSKAFDYALLKSVAAPSAQILISPSLSTAVTSMTTNALMLSVPTIAKSMGMISAEAALAWPVLQSFVISPILVGVCLLTLSASRRLLPRLRHWLAAWKARHRAAKLAKNSIPQIEPSKGQEDLLIRESIKSPQKHLSSTVGTNRFMARTQTYVT